MTTPEEIERIKRTIATLEAQAQHWEEQTLIWQGQPVEQQCRDYAQHIRVMIELQRLKLLD